MANEDLEVKIGANIDDLQKALKKAKASTKVLQDSFKSLSTKVQASATKISNSVRSMSEKFSNSIKKMVSNLKPLGEKMKTIGKSMSIFVTLPVLALGGASIKMASDVQESFNKVDVAFKTSSFLVKEFAKTTLQSFGIAEGSALDMAALFGDMATGMGIGTNAASKLSISLVGLAGDLASFKNMNIKEVTTALNGVFTGETESLKRLGIVMTEANVQAYALSQGIRGNIKKMTQAEKVQLRYAYVLSVTKNAQGDFARTQKDSANQMRIFSEGVKQLSASFGKILLPLFTKIVTKVNDLIKVFSNLSEANKTVILIIAGVTAVIGPLLFTMGILSTVAIPAIITGLGLMSKALMFSIGLVKAFTVALLSNPIGLVVAGVAALGFGLVKLAQYLTDSNSAWETFKNMLKSIVGPLNFMTLQAISANKELEKLSENEKKLGRTRRENGIKELNNALSQYNVLVKDSSTFLTDKQKALQGLEKGTISYYNAEIKFIKEQRDNFATSTEEVKKYGDQIQELTNKLYTLNNGGDTTRSVVTSFDATSSGVSEDDNTLSSVVPSFDKLSDDEARFAEHLVRMKSLMVSFDEQVNEIISGSIAGTFGLLGDAIGNALATGGNVLKAAGNAILSGLSGLLGAMGDQLIKLGTAAVLAGTVVKLFGTITGIGAGIAAIAGGTLLKGIASGLGSLANQSSGGFSGDTGASGNIGANAPTNTNTNFGNSGGSNSLQNVVFEIQGTKLVGVISNTLSRNKSLSGNLSLS